MSIEARQSWQYVGAGDGVGVVHTVTGIFDGGEIATWSDPIENVPGIVGLSWLGPVREFLKVFKRVK